MKLLKSVDILGKDVKFDIEGEPFSTLIGGLFSIFLFLGTISLTWYFGRDIYERVNPKYITTKEYLDIHPMINYSTSGFVFAFRMSKDNNETLIDDPRGLIYKFIVATKMLNKTTGIISSQTIPLKMQRCTNEDVIEPYYSSQNYYNFLCPKFNLTFGGSNEEELYIKPRIEVFRCNRKHEILYNIKCLSDIKFVNLYGGILRTTVKIQNKRHI